MKNKNSIKDIIKVIKTCSGICKEYMWCMGFKSILDSIFPFINIVFLYLILDGLIYKYDKQLIYKYVFYLLILNLIVGVASKVFGYIASRYEGIVSYRLSRQIAQKTYTLDYEQIEDSEVMQLIKKAEEGSNSSGGIVSLINSFYEIVLNSTLRLIYAITLLAGLLSIKDTDSTLLIVKIINNPLSAIIILLSLIIATYLSMFIAKRVNNEGYKVMLKNIDANRKFSYIYDVCSNYKYGKDIRLYSMQDMLMAIMSDRRYSVDSNWREYSYKGIKYQIMGNLISKSIIIISYAYVGLKAIYGLISVGSVVSYVSAITILASSIMSFLDGYVVMNQQATYLKHYFTYLNLPTKMKYGKYELDCNNIEIELKNVSFKYPKQDELILDNVSLKINKGEKIAIVGENGAGKTTLIKLLCRLYDVTSGEILLNNINIKEYSREALYKLFSIVFQDFKLFSYSIKDNITGGNEAKDEDVWLALEKAGIKDRIEKMDNKLNTILYQRNAEKGVEISGGEAQKISLARALYKNSPLVILDEPTSALDPVAEADIYDRFKDMVNDKTSIFISHRMSSCKFCERIVVLQYGKIEEIGSHNELVKNGGLYSMMWKAQAKYYI